MILGFPRAKQGLCHTKHGGAGGIILCALLTVFLVFFYSKTKFHTFFCNVPWVFHSFIKVLYIFFRVNQSFIVPLLTIVFYSIFFYNSFCWGLACHTYCYRTSVIHQLRSSFRIHKITSYAKCH